MSNKLFGIMPAITSPCDENDRFLEDIFASLAEHHFQQGVHGLYVCGRTGDGYNLRTDERRRAAEIAREVSQGFDDGQVIVHIGAGNTREAVILAEHANSIGVSAVASMPPANYTHKELYDYYRDLAKAAKLPLFVYHIPQISNHNLPLTVFQELLDIPGVVGIKFSGSNLFLMKRLLLLRPDTLIFNGDDELLTPALLYGACGGIGMTYNLFPKFFVTLYETVQKGDIPRAMCMQNCHALFLQLALKYGLRASFDLLMKDRGFGPFTYRKPRTVLDEASAKELYQELDPVISEMEQLAGSSLNTPIKTEQKLVTNKVD